MLVPNCSKKASKDNPFLPAQRLEYFIRNRAGRKEDVHYSAEILFSAIRGTFENYRGQLQEGQGSSRPWNVNSEFAFVFLKDMKASSA